MFSSFKVYPNPANEYLVLITEAEASSAFVITDLLGKTFSAGSVVINKTIINTSELSNGSYIIRLLKKDGTIEHKSFIVK